MAQEATPTSTGLPEGITKPLASISSQDQSGLIAIIAAFSLGLVLLSTATRIYVRHAFRLYRLEDFVFIAATVRTFLIKQPMVLIKTDFRNSAKLAGIQRASRRSRQGGRSRTSVYRGADPEGKRSTRNIDMSLMVCSSDTQRTSCTLLFFFSQKDASRHFSCALLLAALTCAQSGPPL